MSERILKALMQLFALVADVDGVSNPSRKIVELFLKHQLSQDMVMEYLVLYDEFLETYHKVSKKKEGKKKRTSLNSVKVLKICTQINTELAQKQKVIVLLRIVEYVNSYEASTEQEDEFITTVAESFNISSQEFNLIKEFTTFENGDAPNNQNTLIINDKPNESDTKNKRLAAENLDGELSILSIESVGLFILKYFGKTELLLNGQAIGPKTCYILTAGSAIRSSKVNPIYYSDIINKFMSDSSQQKIVFTADHIEYEFKGGKKGLHTLTFSEESGKLLGVMGGSGAGKSTLLNVLNGNNRPSSGQVLVNGLSIHDDKDKIEGVVGYVSQDDLLIEELSVFQNLFYNAKLCFDGFTDKEITKRVLNLLHSIGLYEAKDLKVGSPLEKTISGGQRKRLNIALELIREPSVLFVDEPTSGLSSRDSENIMDLLKELALKGKVIFVVIHQPSSDIFKMFDKLLILDLGGRPIYYGNPVDGVLYFKKLSNHVNSDESECIQCGNVNPEQIFNIIESKVLDEYGNLTDNRKVSPKEWNEHYHNEIDNHIEIFSAGKDVPKSTFNIPNKVKQFKVFITRDVLSKLTNTQYLMINLLEAPVLAAVLAFFVKFYHTDVTADGYVFRENENLIAYIFMAVVIALFIGLTVSAEEIIKDQKIRKRESFLNLSSGSYLFSKISIMFVLSALQTLTFVLVGNTILGIQGMYLDYWIVLFSAACFANMLGLNISSSFNSAVTIYISIPFLLIPQLLFSGLIIKFEKLNPVITSQTHVPLIGDSMASRWAFEALAVNQFKNNEFEKHFYNYDKGMSISSFKKTYWIASIKSKLGLIDNHLGKRNEKQKELADGLVLLQNELQKENKIFTKINTNYCFLEVDKLTIAELTKDKTIIKKLKDHVAKLQKFYIHKYNDETDARDKVIGLMQKDEKRAAYLALKDNYENDNLTDLLRNRNEINLIQEIDGNLIQRTDPIFLDPLNFRAQFFAPRKLFFGNYIETFWFNIAILWTMSITLIISLYFDIFRKLMDGLGKISLFSFGKD